MGTFAAERRKRRALLDVNAWVALFDDAHSCFAQAYAFIKPPGISIVTCPLGVSKHRLQSKSKPA